MNEQFHVPVQKSEEETCTAQKHITDMSFLKERNRYLRSHMEILRKKIEDQNRQIELFTELIVKMDEKSKDRSLDLRQLNLN
jgi:hypothetical protein